MIELAHVETNVTIACQNRCSSCNHFVPLQAHDFKRSMLEPEELRRDLANLGRIAHVKTWAAIGGEPLLNPKLVEILLVAKLSPTVEVVEVRTNGQALLEMPEEFWCVTDRLTVTPYPGKLSLEERNRIAELATRFSVGLEWHEPAFVRLLSLPTDPATTAAKYQACWFKTFSRVLDRGFFYRCCTTPFIPKLLLGLAEGTDGLRIDEATSEADLAAYLAQSSPAASCAVCCGIATGQATPIAWREVEEPSAWLEASGYTTSA